MHNYTSGTVHMFELEPGDGTRYTVLFSRLPPTGDYFEGYTVFGFAEAGDALLTLSFNTELVGFHTFAQHWRTATLNNALGDPDYIERAAYTVYAALVGLVYTGAPEDWNPTWRDQLPTATLG